MTSPVRRPSRSAARSAAVAKRRRHHVAQGVRPLVVGALEEQVVRAHLGVDGLPTPPRGADLLERRAAGHVHDVRGGAGDPGEHQEPVHALGLELDRPAGGERLDAEPALGDALPCEQVDRTAVLAVGERHDPELGGLLHDPKRDVVVGHDPELDVGQPQLDAADSEGRGVGEVARAVRLRLPDDGVEGEVDVRLGHLVGERPPGRLRGPLPGSASTNASAVVVPPHSAERVSSRTPPKGWVWTSTAPGRTRQPEASITSARRRDRRSRPRSRPRPRRARPRAPSPSGPTTVPPTIAVAMAGYPTARSGRHGAAPSSRRV